MNWRCPSCGELSSKCYRCTECEADLAKVDAKTEGRMDV